MDYWGDSRREESWYDTMQVCLNGHQITAYAQSQPSHLQKFCSDCGAATITSCQECGAKIKGYYHVPGVLSLSSTPVETNCPECGKPYPWTVANQTVIYDWIEAIDSWSPADKETFRSLADDLLRKTSRSSLAVFKARKMIAKLDSEERHPFQKALKNAVDPENIAVAD